jgi:hypothetical protein
LTCIKNGSKKSPNILSYQLIADLKSVNNSAEFLIMRFPRFDGHGVKDMENDYDDEYEQAVHPGVQAGGRAAAADRE